MIKRDLSDFEKYFGGYTEMRLQENQHNRLVMINGNMTTNVCSTQNGVSARVYDKGLWGFSSNPLIDENSVKAVVAAAQANASFLAEKVSQPGAAPFSGLAQGSSQHSQSFATEKPKASQQERINLVARADAYIKKNCAQLQSRTVALISLDMEKQLLTSEAASNYSLTPRTFLYFTLGLEGKTGGTVELHDIVGGRGQYEDLFADIDDDEEIFAAIDQTYKHLLNKADGTYAVAGMQECVLDADLAGILAHEAIGHTTEADLVLAGSVAGELMHQSVASELVTLVDYAHTAFGQTLPVPVYVDDEGIKSEDTVIIKDGKLKSFLHNKETAMKFETKPTGNARAMDFYDEPLIRMRNTAFVPGHDKLEEMIASIDDGYYLMKSSNGQADSTAEFMFGVVQGYEVKKGKLGKALRNTTISGMAFDVLKSVSMISDEIKWNSAGMCGKKQWIPVGMGGPAIKCRVNLGGR